MKKRISVRLISVLLCLIACISMFSGTGIAAASDKEVTILFTHDIHSYFEPVTSVSGETKYEHGGAARLATLLKEYGSDSSIYLDAGDFSMGTLLSANYAEDAFELRLLGRLGCAATTFGNHEFDFGGTGAAKMLRNAMASGDPLPAFTVANLNFSGTLSDEQKEMKSALEEYGEADYIVKEVNGVKIAVFGVMGYDSIDCAPTSGMVFDDYIETAKRVVSEIGGKADVVVCISHGGTNGDGETGEDFELAEAVSGIDVIISGHSHTKYDAPIELNGTYIVSSGTYLKNLGVMKLSVGDTVTCTDYKNVPCDENVAEDPDTAALVAEEKDAISGTYLKNEGFSFDDVLTRSDFDISTDIRTDGDAVDFPVGNLIADSYMYAAKQNGIDDVDVALVGLGTIRSSIYEGDVTPADAFEVCSLGIGGDDSAGHPLVMAYITGKELKLLCNLDCSLGGMVSYIKMSYSGLEFTANSSRMLLDRVTDIHIVREDGTREEIEDDRLYKIVFNMYAGNMLGMLNGLTKGVLSIELKNADGTPMEDFYDNTMKTPDGREQKEWTAFAHYLASFDKIPDNYASAEGRKIYEHRGGFAVISHPGMMTWIVIALALVIIAVIALITVKIIRKSRRKKVKV